MRLSEFPVRRSERLLFAMVHEINEMEVALEERLTDSIYPMRLADGEYRLSVIRP